MTKLESKLSRIAKRHNSKISEEKLKEGKNTPIAFEGSDKILINSLKTRYRVFEVLLNIISFSIPLGLVILSFYVTDFWNDVEKPAKWTIILALVIIVLLGLLFMYVTNLIVGKIRIKQLKRNKYKFNFNHEEYVQQLRQARRNGKLIIHVEFTENWTEEEQKEAAVAAKAIDPEIEEADWQDAKTFVIVTSFLGTVTEWAGEDNYGADPSHFNNKYFHLSFKKFHKKILPLMHDVHAVRNLKVHIKGDIYSPKAEPDRFA